jgi:monoamine oxidase
MAPRNGRPGGFFAENSVIAAGGPYDRLRGGVGAGVWTQYGQALAAPVGRIHWAGAETSPIWNGYMDGAIRSGRRAAAEILTGTS